MMQPKETGQNSEQTGQNRQPVAPFTETDLAIRLGVKPATIRQWRVRKFGPPYIKVGRLVRYRVADVAAWEQSHLHLFPDAVGSAA